MQITRRSHVTGIVRTRDLPITPEQWLRYQQGELIQRAFPNLSAADREFILTGVSDEEWNELLGPEEDGEYEE